MFGYRRIALLLLLGLATVPAVAQRVPTRALDSRIRIQTAQAVLLTGRVVRVVADSVAIRNEQTREVITIAQSDILGVEAWSGLSHGRAAQRGALIGGGLGVAALAVGLLADAQVKGESMGLSNVAIAAPVAVLLTLLGTGIGAMSGGGSWQTLAPISIGSSTKFGPTVSVGLRMKF
jgi:hypothetical protein